MPKYNSGPRHIIANPNILNTEIPADKGFITIDSSFLINHLLNILDEDSIISNTVYECDRYLIVALLDKYVRQHETLDKATADLIVNLVVSCEIIDILLFFTQKRYRDHQQHQLKVAALGSLLLGAETRNSHLTLCETIADTKDWKVSDVYLSWWIASLLHDHAYPLSVLLSTIPKLANLEERFRSLDNNVRTATQGLFRNTQALLSSYDTLLSADMREIVRSLWSIEYSERTNRWLEEIIEREIFKIGVEGNIRDVLMQNVYDHGLLAGVNIASLLEENIGVWEDVKRHPCIIEALKAICFHNITQIKSISFLKDPIAYLLILCDELQEWDRVFLLHDGSEFVEVEKIHLGPFEKSSNKIKFGRLLRVNFPYNEAVNEIQIKTDWNLEKMRITKKTNIERLIGPFEIRMSFDVDELLAGWQEY